MTGPYHIAVLFRSLDVLEALRDAGRLSLSELSQRLGLPRSSVFRILVTLESRGYVEHLPNEQGYALGAAAVTLANGEYFAAFLCRRARPVLERLASQLGETVNLGMLVGTEIVYIDMVESHFSMRMNVTVGSRNPAYSTALGKALLAFCRPGLDLDLLFPDQLPQITAKTIRSREELKRHLELVRSRGWSMDDEENEPGARCIGAPILGADGHALAAISVAGPVSRLTDGRVDEVARLALAAAQQIQEELHIAP